MGVGPTLQVSPLYCLASDARARGPHLAASILKHGPDSCSAPCMQVKMGFPHQNAEGPAAVAFIGPECTPKAGGYTCPRLGKLKTLEFHIEIDCTPRPATLNPIPPFQTTKSNEHFVIYRSLVEKILTDCRHCTAYNIQVLCRHGYPPFPLFLKV